MLLTQHFNCRSERSKHKELRNNATAAEQCLWQQLNGKRVGAKFRRQYSIDAYVVDFYAPAVKLAVEVDGDSHFTPDAMEYDRERTNYLTGFGIAVLPFTNLDVVENLDGVLVTIAEAVQRRRATSP